MTISPVGSTQQSYVSQLASTQAAQAASAVSVDSPLNGADDTSTTTSNSLTGTTGSNLDSNTLQALLDLTQQDPSQQTGSASQSGQAGKAHHHHHHGGGMQPPSAPASTPTSSDLGQTTAAGDTEDSTDASLETALLTA